MRACRNGSSPYVIQGVSATVRGRSKLMGEGMQRLKEVNGRPPNRLTRRVWAWFRPSGRRVQAVLRFDTVDNSQWA